MRVPLYTRQFQKDIRRLEKQNKNLGELKHVMTLLMEEKNIPPNFKDHPLLGYYKGFRECHIKPDWLLIYKIEGVEIYFTRTGSHSELFK